MTKTNQELQLKFPQALLKRLLDIVFAVFGLVVSGPILILVSLLIKLDSPGPVIYKYRRLGPDGREIDVYHFRTMRIDLNDSPIIGQMTKNDPRFTKFGLFLRRVSIDTFPLFFNVLKGDMSVVGPRPKLVAEYEYYRSIANTPIHLKPGITFMFRDLGYGPPVSKDETKFETIRLRYEQEKFYIQNWSIWLDFKIMGQTLVRGFR